VPKDDQTHPDVIRLVAHDLRNPLTAIQLNAQLIERAAESDGRDKVRRWATLITGAARRLDEMIGQLVEAERLRTGRWQLALAPVAWDQLLREVIAQASADRPGQAQVRLRVPEAAVMVTADRERLGRAMRNLLHLVARGTDGTGAVEVTLAERDGQACCALVSSVSASASELPTEPAGEGSQLEPGQGIALHFARSIIEALGGQLRVRGGDARAVGFDVALRVATSART
jgi:K+-sensing histidine kinase KdpD